jgi:hypothetical protein
MFSRWRWQLGTADERAQLRLRAPHPAGVVRQAAAEVPPVPQQTVGRVAFEVVPELLRRIECRRISRELLEMQPRMRLAHRVDSRPAVNRAAVPQQDDGSPEMPQERTKEVGHIDRLEVPWLEAEVQPQMLALGGHREGGQGRDPVMLRVVADEGRMPRGRPGAAAGRNEPKAALIQEGEVGPKSSGFFVWPATWSAASGPWPARRVGWPALRAADNSSLSDARASRRVPGDRAPHRPPGSPPRSAVRSAAHWQTQGRWPPGARARPVGYTVGRLTGAAGQGWAWGPRPPPCCQAWRH